MNELETQNWISGGQNIKYLEYFVFIHKFIIKLIVLIKNTKFYKFFTHLYFFLIGGNVIWALVLVWQFLFKISIVHSVIIYLLLSSKFSIRISVEPVKWYRYSREYFIVFNRYNSKSIWYSRTTIFYIHFCSLQHIPWISNIQYN